MPNWELRDLLALSGPAIAALALVLNYRERTKSYREAIFRQQIVNCEALLKHLAQLQQKVQLMLFQAQSKSLPVPDSEKRRIYSEIHSRSPFRTVKLLVLPDQVIKAANACMKTCFEAVSAPDATKATKLVEDSFIEVKRTMRQNLGVDPLSKETLAIVRELDTLPTS